MCLFSGRLSTIGRNQKDMKASTHSRTLDFISVTFFSLFYVMRDGEKLHSF